MSIKPAVKLFSSLLGRNKPRALDRYLSHFAGLETLEARQMLSVELSSLVAFGGKGDEANQQTVVDHVGNVYAVGTFVGRVDVNPGAKVTALKGETAPGTVYLAKYDPKGALVWARQLGDGAVIPLAAGLAVDGANNLYIAGSFEGTIDFNPGTRITALTSAGKHDAFVVKIDTGGELVWARRFGGVGDDFVTDVAVNPNNYIAISGRYTEEVDFDPGIGEVIAPAPTVVGSEPLDAYDGFINVLDDQGEFAALNTIDAPNIEAIAIDDDSYYLAGHFRGNDVDFDPTDDGQALFSSSNSGLADDVFVQRLNFFGAVEWVQTLSGNVTFTQLGIDSSGNVIVSGAASGTVATTTPDTDVDPIDFPEAGGGFLVSADVDTGEVRWIDILGSKVAGFDVSGENIYTAGVFSGTSDFNPYGAPTTLTANRPSTFVGSYSADTGVLTWIRGISGTGSTSATSVGFVNNDIVVGGAFSGTTDFDPNRSVKSAKSAGGTDTFIARIRQTFASGSRPLNSLAAINFVDGDGDRVTISLKGPGNGNVSFNTGSVDTNIGVITLANTTTKTILTITNKTGTTTLAGMNITGSLGSILASSTTLTGAATITGDVSTVTFGNAGGASFNVNATTAGTTTAAIEANSRRFTFASVAGLSLVVNAPIAAVTVGSWNSNGSTNQIVTPGLGTVVATTGSFTPNLTLSGANLKAGTPTLGSVNAAGALSGAWNIVGPGGNIVAGSISYGWSLTSNSSIGIITTGNFAGSLTALTAVSANINGNFSGSILLTTTSNNINAIGRITVLGTIDGGSIRTSGNLGSISAGAIRNSSIFAGVKSSFTTTPSSSGLPDGQSDFESDRTIESVVVNGIEGQSFNFINSNIAAWNIGAVRLVDIQTSNAGVPFGVAATDIGNPFGLTDLADFKLRTLII